MTRTGKVIVSDVFLVMTTLGAVACSDSSPTQSSETTYTIQLSPTSVSLLAPPGEPRSAVVVATIRTSNGSIVHQAVVWSTDSPAVATVTQAGTVSAVSPGSTVLRARFGGSEASAAIAVTAPTFTMTGSMATARIAHTATLLPDGKVLIVGGKDRADALGRETAAAELYDPASGTFTRTGDMARARSAHSASLLPNGKVLVSGGIVGNDVTATAELYDPATGTFGPTGDMNRKQAWHASTLLTTGKVLISGGSSACCPAAPTPELYDPATGLFTTTGTYAGVDLERDTQGLMGINATLLRDGRVLLSAVPAAQLYDPVAGTFSRTGSMITGNGAPYVSGQTASLLDDGKVLVAGGHNEDLGRFKTADLYDPATGRFVATGSMAFVRDLHSATLLANGTVLIAGGEGVDGCAVLSLGSAEVYDPATGVFTTAGKLNVRREWHTATRLKDGRVLVTGGLTFDGGLCAGSFTAVALASAELFVPPN